MPLLFTIETADSYIIGAIFLVVHLENTTRSYATTIVLFATPAKLHFCIVLEIIFDDHILVAFLGMSPDVEYCSKQQDDDQRYELGQLVGDTSKAIAGNGGICRDKDEVASDGSIDQRKQCDDPRTDHATRYSVWAIHIRILVA